MEKGKIDITPDTSLMIKLGYSGYSVTEAIGELVENSIDAKIPDEMLYVKVKVKKDEISIVDDGEGMDRKTAEKALTIAHSDKKDKLGKFGMGMKAACGRLGEYFKIKTKQNGGNEFYLIEFDKTKWEHRKEWKHELKTIPAEFLEYHGTEIIIKNLKIKIYPQLTTRIKNYLSTKFLQYLRNREVKIQVNSATCEYIQPELIEGSKKDVNIDLGDGKKITGWVGYLKKSSQKGLYGFHLYGKNRMIAQYKKFGFREHPTHARIVGELNLDHLEVTYTKQKFLVEAKEYLEAESAMKEFLKPILSEVKKIRSREKFKKLSNDQLKNLEQAVSRLKPEEKIEYQIIHTIDSFGKNGPWKIIENHQNKITIITNDQSPILNLVKDFEFYYIFQIIDSIAEIKAKGDGKDFFELREDLLLNYIEIKNSIEKKKELLRDQERINKELEKLSQKGI